MRARVRCRGLALFFYFGGKADTNTHKHTGSQKIAAFVYNTQHTQRMRGVVRQCTSYRRAVATCLIRTNLQQELEFDIIPLFPPGLPRRLPPSPSLSLVATFFAGSGKRAGGVRVRHAQPGRGTVARVHAPARPEWPDAVHPLRRGSGEVPPQGVRHGHA